MGIPGKDVVQPVNRDHYVRDRLWIGDNLISRCAVLLRLALMVLIVRTMLPE